MSNNGAEKRVGGASFDGELSVVKGAVIGWIERIIELERELV